MMSWVENRIKVGDMVIRAYNFEPEEFGLVVETKTWAEDVKPPDADDTPGQDHYDAMSNSKVFTVLWPAGNLTSEMDVELYNQEYYLKVMFGPMHRSDES